ncbi:MAG: M81 family metallopeptidase [Proteobacteria bacterium]|nr:M81 family metallopeptidase [Pseudomonadota bacterium]
MRVFAASLSCETNTFSPIPTGLAAFHERAYFPGGSHPAQMLHCSGPLWAARQRSKEWGWELIEGLVASAMPGGTTTREAYEALRDDILADLRSALPVNIVLLGLHGAMVADGYDDCEGDLLTKVRELVGPGVVIGAELDPHCHLSAAMTAQADILVCFKEYPHTDVLERGQELVELCRAAALGRVKPVASVVDCRMMGDVADMGTQILVYSDGDKPRGDSLARILADELFGMREQLRLQYPGIDAALDEALAHPGAPVVLADSADNAGGGAPGDSTFILRRLLERQIASAALGPLCDPMAVRLAFEAGIGARLPLRIGGKVGPVSGDPLDAICTIKELRPAMLMSGLAETSAPLGDCALLAIEGVDVVLSSVRCPGLDIDLFTQLGCDPRDKKIVVVKSSQHFYASFSKIAAKVIYVDSPGALCTELSWLPYKKIRRPKWPL